MRILYIDIDTLRPDHLGCYGYNRDTSPNIDKIAEQGVRFENYYCSDAPCLPSRTALTTGRFGIRTGVINHGGKASEIYPEGASRSFTGNLSHETLPGILSQNGLKTATISPFADRHGSWTFYAGFKEIYDTGKKGLESAEEITPTALKWIKDNAEDDSWFLHINYWDPHTPYRVPLEFGYPFEDTPLSTWITKEILEKHRSMVGPYKPRELSMYNNRKIQGYPRQLSEIKDMADLKKVIDGYDTGIRYADHHVGIIVNTLKNKGVLDDTVIIISSDHGENFGEQGIYAEHSLANNATTRIPLIIRWPGITKKNVNNGLHYNLDLLPTLYELINFCSGKTSDRKKIVDNNWDGSSSNISTCKSKISKNSSPSITPDYNWDGQSFADTIKSGKDCSRDYLVLSQCAHVCQRSVRFSDYIYIRTYHDGYHLFPEEMLFNVKDDPHEQYNLAQDNPELIEKARSFYKEWHNNMMSSKEDTEDPLNTVLAEGGPYHTRGKLKEYIEYLKQTGRDYAIEELIKRHPEEMV